MVIVFWPTRVTFSLILVAGSSGAAGLYLMLGLVLVLAPFWYLAIRSGRRERQRWVRRGQAFDEGAGTMRRGRMAGHFHGREVALFYTGGGRRRPRCFNAQLACSSPLSFEIDPRATIVIGKAKNSFETGDAGLDRDFAFVSDAPERFKAWFQKPENKQKLVAGLRQSSHRCRVEMKTGRLTWGIRGGLETEQDLLSAPTASAQSRFIQTDEAKLGDLERDRTRELLENLNQLAAALESEF